MTQPYEAQAAPAAARREADLDARGVNFVIGDVVLFALVAHGKQWRDD
jgi:hypothetical protein